MEIPKLRGHKNVHGLLKGREDNFFYIRKSYYLKRNLNRGHYLAERIYQATYTPKGILNKVCCGLTVVNVLPQ